MVGGGMVGGRMVVRLGEGAEGAGGEGLGKVVGACGFESINPGIAVVDGLGKDDARAVESIVLEEKLDLSDALANDLDGCGTVV